MEQLVVVKIGGVASDNLTPEFYKQLHNWQKLGKKIVLVHGGGHYISSMMERLDMSLTIQNGVRVTTADTLEIVKIVLLGQVQPTITESLMAQGLTAIGLNAADDHLLIGQQSSPELGFVGDVCGVNRELIEEIAATGVIPVIAPMALTQDGQWLNVNADVTACAIASALGAEKLYLLTDVSHVQYHNQSLTYLSHKLIKQMTADGAISGGMLPKITSALAALKNGVKTVHITDRLQAKGTILQA